MKKTVLLLSLAAVLILVSAAALADTHNTLETGECGDNVTWEVWEDADGVQTLEVSGSGPISQSLYVDGPFVQRIIVNEGVTSICDYAFTDSWSMKRVTEISLPASCTSIGRRAFFSDILRSLTLPEGLQAIGDNAFFPFNGTPHAYSVVVIPRSVTQIGYGALDDMVPAVYSDSAAFTYCQENYISNYILLSSTGSHLMDLFKAVAQVEDVPQRYRCLAISVLKTMNLTDSQCDSLRDYVLNEEQALKLAMLDDSLTAGEILRFLQRFMDAVDNIGVQITYEITFFNGFPGVRLTATVNGESKPYEIYRTADHTWTVKNVTPSENSSYLYVETEDGILITGYTGDDTDLVIPSSIQNIPVVSIANVNNGFSYGITSLTIPEGIKTIGSHAFYYRDSLETVHLPGSLENIGLDAFYGCGLTDVYYAGTAEDWFSVQGVHSDPFADAVLHCSDATVTAHGTCGEQTVWWLDENGLLTIGGSGDMEHYGTVAENVINSPWFSHINDITGVAIGENVTGIGVSAFAMAVNLQSVTIPAGITSIAPWAFHGCSGLTEILVDSGSGSFASADGVLYTKDMTSLVCYPAGKAGTSYDIPASVTDIRAAAFWGCGSLTAVSIPNGVTAIGDQAFSRCGVLRFDIPDSVTSIGTYAFAVCDSLTGVRLPAGLTELSDYIFAWSQNLYDVIIPGSVTSIGSGAFSGTKITCLVIPDGVTEINDEVCVWCGSLSSVILPDGLTRIGIGAFSGTQIQNLTIPEGVTSIGENAFIWCSQLQVVAIPQSVTSVGNSAFEGCNALDVIYYSGTQEQWDQIEIGSGNNYLTSANRISSLETSGSFGDDFYWSLSGDGTLTVSGTGEMPGFWNISEMPWFAHTDEIVSAVIEPGITSLGFYAFKDCANLTSVTLPDSLTEIQVLAFFGCESLTSFAIPANLQYLDYSVFAGCRNLAEITIDPSNTFFVLEDGVLFSADRTELICYPPKKPDSDYTVPDTVTAIHGAFPYCVNLTSVTLPGSLTELIDGAFDGCDHLTDIYFGGSPDQWNQLIAGWEHAGGLGNVQIHYAYLGAGSCGENARWFLDNDGTLTISGTGSMEEYDIDFLYDGGNYVIISTSPWYSLRDQILSIAIETGITSVGSEAFTDCTKASSVSLPDTVTAIGQGAFRLCTGLTSFSVPAGCTDIGPRSFTGCSSIAAFTVTGGNTAFTAEDGVLFSYDRSTLLAYPPAKTDPSYTVPESVTEIGALSFADCKSLSDVLLGSHVSSIGESAFEGCSSLTGLTIPDSVVSIEPFAFNYCTGLTSLTVGTGLDFVGLCSFNACDSLTDVFYKGSRARWNRILIGDENGPLVAAEKHYHAGVPVPEVNLALPAALTEIESEAFAGLPAGTVVLIPDTVTAIADGAFDEGTVFIAPENSFAAEWATDHGFDCFEQ